MYIYILGRKTGLYRVSHSEITTSITRLLSLSLKNKKSTTTTTTTTKIQN